jgi:hypothetical protein
LGGGERQRPFGFSPPATADFCFLLVAPIAKRYNAGA